MSEPLLRTCIEVLRSPSVQHLRRSVHALTIGRVTSVSLAHEITAGLAGWECYTEILQSGGTDPTVDVAIDVALLPISCRGLPGRLLFAFCRGHAYTNPVKDRMCRDAARRCGAEEALLSLISRFLDDFEAEAADPASHACAVSSVEAAVRARRLRSTDPKAAVDALSCLCSSADDGGGAASVDAVLSFPGGLSLLARLASLPPTRPPAIGGLTWVVTSESLRELPSLGVVTLLCASCLSQREGGTSAAAAVDAALAIARALPRGSTSLPTALLMLLPPGEPGAACAAALIASRCDVVGSLLELFELADPRCTTGWLLALSRSDAPSWPVCDGSTPEASPPPAGVAATPLSALAHFAACHTGSPKVALLAAARAATLRLAACPALVADAVRCNSQIPMLRLVAALIGPRFPPVCSAPPLRRLRRCSAFAVATGGAAAMREAYAAALVLLSATIGAATDGSGDGQGAGFEAHAEAAALFASVCALHGVNQAVKAVEAENVRELIDDHLPEAHGQPGGAEDGAAHSDVHAAREAVLDFLAALYCASQSASPASDEEMSYGTVGARME